MRRVLFALAVVWGAFIGSSQSSVKAQPTGPPPNWEELSGVARRKPYSELVEMLRDDDRDKQLLAVEVLKNHHKGRVTEVLPQLIEVLADELAEPSVRRGWRTLYIPQTVAEAAELAGPGRMGLIRESARHEKPRIRAAAYSLWYSAACDRAIGLEPGEVLDAARRGLKDDSPVVRLCAVYMLRAFFDGRLHGVAPPAYRHVPREMVDQVIQLLVATLEDRIVPHPGVRKGGFVSHRVPSPAEYASIVLGCLSPVAKPAVPALARAVASDDPNLVRRAAWPLNRIARGDESVGKEVAEILAALVADAARRDEHRALAADGLREIGPAIRWVMNDLVAVYQDARTPGRVRSSLRPVFGDSGPRAAPAVAALVNQFESASVEVERAKAFSRGSWVARTNAWWVRRYVVTPLEEEESGYLWTFKKIGPAAAPAVPAIERWMADPHRPLRYLGHEAINAIKS